MKQLWILAVIVGVVIFFFAIATLGVDGGGKSNDVDQYCRVLLKGELIGNNLELGDLECGKYPYPASILELRLVGGDDDIYCQASVDGGEFGERKSMGDLGFTESAYYNFKISNIPTGYHMVKISCQGKSASVEKEFKLGVIEK